MSQERISGSVTGWIEKLKDGDEEAARLILERYFDQIVAVARQRIRGGTLGIADEEDVAIEAFQSVCKAAVAGRLNSLRTRDDLWRMLVATASRKLCDYWRIHSAQKRGGKRAAGASASGGASNQQLSSESLDQVAVEKASAEFLAAIADQHRLLMEKLESEGSQLREIADLLLEGHTNREIAEKLKCSQRRIERKRSLIRNLWQHAAGEQP